MKQTRATTTESQVARAEDQTRVIDLRRFWRWRAALAVLALAFCVLFFGAMTFIGRPDATPPAPEAVQAAWQELVTDTLARNTPAEAKPVALPTSQHSKTGLLRVRSAD